MRQIWRLAVAILVLSSLPSAAATLCAEDSVDVAAIVNAVGRRAVETDNVVGVSIGVAHDDTVLCVKGFGRANVELDVPATAETVYRIGSITKQFTAVAILLLAEDAKLQLDDPLSKFLPDYPPPGCNVTIRNLLQHTSGIKDFTRLPGYRRELPIDVTQEEVLHRFQNLPLDFEPGAQHRYCNSGYFLLGLIIEKASGKSFRDFAEERLFKALKLKRTYCDAAARIVPHRASGYASWGGVLRNAPAISLKQAVGAGNLASTVGDLLAWQRGLVAHRLLSPESTQMMKTKGELKSGKSFDYGLGVLIRKLGDHEVIRHAGGISGFRSDLAHYPASGYTIAVLANSGSANASRISDQLARRLLAESTDGKSD